VEILPRNPILIFQFRYQFFISQTCFSGCCECECCRKNHSQQKLHTDERKEGHSRAKAKSYKFSALKQHFDGNFLCRRIKGKNVSECKSSSSSRICAANVYLFALPYNDDWLKRSQHKQQQQQATQKVPKLVKLENRNAKKRFSSSGWRASVG